MSENVVETDVLVIGGGLAGCFAAVKARELNVDVTLTDLIRQRGRVVGAMGFHTRTGEFCLIKAKAIVMASGGLGFRAVRYGSEFNTGDGMARTG